MTREKMRAYRVVEYKWIFLSKVTIVTLLLLMGVALYAMARKAGTSQTEYPLVVTEQASSAAGEHRVKTAVLKWMKDNSRAPEAVLSRIYDQAAITNYPELVLAICLVESNFDPEVKSHKGAIGLMGIMPAVWHKELREQGIIREPGDLFMISKNIRSGLYVLKQYLVRSRDLEEALLGYVGGDHSYSGKVMKALREVYRVKMLN